MESNKLRRKNTNKFSNKYSYISGNITVGQGFAEERKKLVISQYKKLRQKEQKKSDFKTGKLKKFNSSADDKHSVQRPGKSNKIEKKVSSFDKARSEWIQNKEDKQQRLKELAEKKKQKEEATVAYKKKKFSQHKKLAIRTYKGQPNMASQMDVILEKIERQRQLQSNK